MGFAWQVPWFGGKTTVRGGYSMQYQRLTVRDDILASAPGNTLNQVAAITDPDIASIISDTRGQLQRPSQDRAARAPGGAGIAYPGLCQEHVVHGV